MNRIKDYLVGLSIIALLVFPLSISGQPTSLPSQASQASSAKFKTATRTIAGGYIVEAAISLDAEPLAIGQFLGFDVQVNNDASGSGQRASVATWNDSTGLAYQDTSVFGSLRLRSAGTGQ